MKKVFKVIGSILIIAFLIGCIFGFKSCGNIKAINNTNIKKRWGGNINNYDEESFVWRNELVSQPTWTKNNLLYYSDSFNDNLGLIYPSSNNSTKINLTAWYRFWAFTLAIGKPNIDFEYIDEITTYLVNNDEFPSYVQPITNSQFEYRSFINEDLELILLMQPKLYLNEFGENGSIRKREFTIEIFSGLAAFDKNNFVRNFYSNDGTFIDFESIDFEIDFNLFIENSHTGQPVESDYFEEKRPRTRLGALPQIIYQPQVWFNRYNESEDQNEFKVLNNPRINLNDSNYDGGDIYFNFKIFDKFENQVLGLNVLNTYDPNGNTNFRPINNSKALRGIQSSHNYMIVQNSINAYQLSDEMSYHDGYVDGYQNGLTEGQSQWNWTNFLNSIFDSIDRFLNVEILPYFKLWYFIGIPVIFGLLKFILSWFR